MNRMPPQQVIAYVDGFNLYFGLREKGYKRYYWLNIQAMVESLLTANQKLVLTKYFTARISGPDVGKARRQSRFLEALQTLSSFNIYYGHYLAEITKCRNCGHTWPAYEEKMTDVNIAAELLTDAFEGRFDTALVISADSDLVPAVAAAKRLFPEKRVVVFFPPGRSSAQLQNVADTQLTLGRATLARSQFPDKVVKPDGYVLERPAEWR